MIKVDLDVLMTLDFQIGLRTDRQTSELTDNANSRVAFATEYLPCYL